MKTNFYTWLILIVSFIGCTTLYSQTVEPDYCGGDRFYDNGGELGEYTGYEGGYTETIYPDSEGERIRVIFDYIDTSNFLSSRLSLLDYLNIYNGEDASGELLGSHTTTNNREYVSTHSSGALTFTLSLNRNEQISRGWDAQIICEEKPSCINIPENFNASEITYNSVSLQWDYEDNSEFSEFVIEYGETGFELGSGTVVTTNEYTTAISNLEPFTKYQVYIKAMCNEGTFSESKNLRFTTQTDYCGGNHFTDSSTANRELPGVFTETIYPGIDGGRVRVLFNTFIYAPFGTLTVYNGEDRSELIGRVQFTEFDGEVLSPDNEFISTHSSGALTFYHTSGFINSPPAISWDAEVFCESVAEITLPINNTSELVTGYDTDNQHSGVFETIDNRNTLQLNGNAWAKTDLNYTITENTLMEFDIKITNEGEIHGILFDNDDTHNNGEDSSKLFQVSGSQNYGIQDYNIYTGNDWVSYCIPVGEFFTGDFNNLVFVADKDANAITQESFFRNINFSENTFPINNTPEGVTGFDIDNQHNGIVKTIDNGNTLQLDGNTWAKGDFNYNLTENTVVEFDIKITGEGEIHGILLEDNNILDGDDSDRLFQISGTQIYGIQDYNNYEGNDWVSYAIPIGRFFTGDFNNIVFVADKDADPTNQESFFRNVNFSEQITFPINNTPEIITEYGRDKHFGTFETVDTGNTLQLDGNAWVKAGSNYSVTENTVIEFDIKITGEGEVNGILFENDNSFSASDRVRLFQIAGSDTIGVQDYNTYSGNDWVSYSIPLGEFFTGDFDNIVFVADKDVDPTTQESFFRNVNIFENTLQNLASKQISSLSTINQIEASFVGPNPANEYIDIQSSFNQVISEAYVYSMNGSLIKKVTNHNSDKLHLDVSDIPDGMYLINYIIGVESHVTKLVVKH